MNEVENYIIDLPTKDDNKSCSKTGQLLLSKVSIF